MTTAILNLMRDAALAYTIGFIDIMGAGNNLISRNLGNYSLETYTAVAVIYWGIALVISPLSSTPFEKRLSVTEVAMDSFYSKSFLATLGGVPVTLLIMVVSILLSFFPALFLALGQIYKVKGVRSFSVVYLAFIRATPPILLILFFYSLFPSLLNSFFKSIGSHFNVFEINPIYYAFIIFSLMTTGSLAEILRSAILTVDKGQLEAAQAIGLTNRQAYIRIVFPQALRSALPNLCNLVINLVKGTSLVFVMTIKDITAIAKVEASYGYQYFESYLVIFILYIVICGVIQWGFNLLEKRLTLA